MDLVYGELMQNRLCVSSGSLHGIRIIETTNSEYDLLIMRALDLYYTEKMWENGTCTVCNKSTKLFCKNCGVHYCSSKCQSEDWLRHSKICSRNEPASSVSVSNIYETDSMSQNITDEMSFKGSETHTAKKEAQLQSQNKDKSPLNKNHETSEVASKNDQNKLMQQEDKFVTKKFREISTKEETLNMKFSIGDVITVKFLTYSKKKYIWAYEKNEAKMKLLNNILSSECHQYPDVTAPEYDVLYAIQRNNKWQRCRVVKKSEKKIRCVDVGCFFTLKKGDVLKLLPAELQKIGEMALKIVPETFPQEGTVNHASVQIYDIDRTQELYYVRILQSWMPIQNNPKTGDSKPNSTGPVRRLSGVLNKSRSCAFRSVSRGTFHWIKIEGSIIHGLVIPEDHDKHNIDKILNLKRVLKSPKSFTIGSDVLVTNMYHNNRKLRNECCRGIILSKSPGCYHVWLIDFGILVEVDRVYEIDEDLTNICELACKLTVKDMPSFKRLNQSWKYSVEKINEDNSILCTLSDIGTETSTGNDFILARMDEAEIYPKDSTNPFHHGCKVTVGAVISNSEVVLTAVNTRWISKLKKLNNKINQSVNISGLIPGVNVQSLKIGDLILAKYMGDGLWYRARVMEKRKECPDKCKVEFVDFVDCQVANKTELALYPNMAKKLPHMTAAVKLCSTNNEFTADGMKYLKLAAREKTEYTILHFGLDKKYGVTLVDKDGFYINEIAYEEDEKAVAEADKIIDSFNFYYMKEGLVDNFILLHVNKVEFEAKGIFWATSLENNKFQYLLKEIMPALNEFCNSNNEIYKPGVGEFCCVKYEGSWFRGIVTKIMGKYYNVFFFDFGSSDLIREENLRRKLPKMFSNIDGIVAKCIISDFDKLRKDEIETLYIFIVDKINTILQKQAVIMRTVNRETYVKFVHPS